jgi:hypothetical protein
LLTISVKAAVAIATAAMDVRVFKESAGWFVMTNSKMGPYPRDVAESLAKGMAFAIRSSGGEARIVFSDSDEPWPDDEDAS